VKEQVAFLRWDCCYENPRCKTKWQSRSPAMPDICQCKRRYWDSPHDTRPKTQSLRSWLPHGARPGRRVRPRSQISRMVVAGLLNKQIGSDLGISEITVKAHRGRMMHKMKADSLADLVNMAARLGLARAPKAL
jgi:DNA-binding CsgD family transcriptional regulator